MTIEQTATVTCDGDGCEERVVDAPLLIRELMLPGPQGIGLQTLRNLTLPDGWGPGLARPSAPTIVHAGGFVRIDAYNDSLPSIASKTNIPQPGLFCPKCLPKNPPMRAAEASAPPPSPKRIVT